MSEEVIDCTEALDLLQDFLKREVTPDLADRVARHLDVCGPCLHHAEFQRRYLQLLRDRIGRQGCPESLRTRVIRALRDEASGH